MSENPGGGGNRTLQTKSRAANMRLFDWRLIYVKYFTITTYDYNINFMVSFRAQIGSTVNTQSNTSTEQ